MLKILFSKDETDFFDRKCMRVRSAEKAANYCQVRIWAVPIEEVEPAVQLLLPPDISGGTIVPEKRKAAESSARANFQK